MQAEKNTWGHYSPLFLSNFKDCVMTMFDFGIFCHLLKLMGIYWVGAPSGYLRRFVFSFLFFLFFLFYFSFSFFFFLFIFLSRSLGAPSSSGAPGHCPPMPPSCSATDLLLLGLRLLYFVSSQICQSIGFNYIITW